ncbi:MAG: tRNA lysidine(34) synthetase TilS [Acidobacteria bacterium]|nr:tRNA lysidine(34) synthetase TilS [Acidobacteriota bacterium]
MLGNHLIKQVLETIRKHKMLSAGERVLVAVSGGPDSMALLKILADLRKKLGLVLAVAHFDHQIRLDSNLDLEFARRAADQFWLPFFSERRDIPNLVQASGGNLEEVARLQRRAFLTRVCQQGNFNKIASGHTMDDQAETVLMNLIRGSGPTGLAGIAPRAGKWVRPLIATRRAEILDFLKKENITFRLDPTNLDTRLLRNRVRHQLIPMLEKDYSPHLVERLAKLAEMERATRYYWKRSSRRWLHIDSSGPFVRAQELVRRPVAEQREVIRHFILLSRGHLRRITFEQIEGVRNLTEKGSGGKEIVLPGGWEITNVRGELRAAGSGGRGGASRGRQTTPRNVSDKTDDKACG